MASRSWPLPGSNLPRGMTEMSALSQLELEARNRRIDEAETDDFAELIRIAGLDPKKHLRFADWSGVDFSGCDLRGFDFTGARLIGCNFKDAWIEGARFDQALIDEARPGEKVDRGRTDLRAAKDWVSVNWRRRNKPRRNFCRRACISRCSVCAGDGGCPAGTVQDGVERWRGERR